MRSYSGSEIKRRVYSNIHIYSKDNIELRGVSDVKINHGSLQSDWTSTLFKSSRKTACKSLTASILALI